MASETNEVSLDSLVAFFGSWPDLLRRIHDVWAQQPAFFFLIVPCLCALVSGSLTALVISVLVTGLGLAALQLSPEASYQWGIAAVVSLAGILAAVQAFLFRRNRRRLSQGNAELLAVKNELHQIQLGYQNEVRWRKAIASLAVSKGTIQHLANRPALQPTSDVRREDQG